MSPGFWLALAVGLALRLWYLSDLSGQPWFGYPIIDALSFDKAALTILQGEPQGVHFRPPLYPLFLAGVYATAGHSATGVALTQFALGLLTLVPAHFIGERWFGSRAAVAGTWIGACYPLRIFFEGEALDVTLFSFLFVLATWSLWLALERVSVPGVFLAGALYGAAALARPNVLIALPLIGLGAVLTFRISRHRLPALGFAGACGVALALAPVTLHNWRAEPSFVLVAANGGVNFFLGNERSATGLTPVPPGLRWEQVMLRPIREGITSVSAQERWWYARAAEEIRAAPARWLAQLGKKTVLFAGAAEASNNKPLDHFTAVSAPVRHYRLWFGALVCLSLLAVLMRQGPANAFFACLVAGFGASVVLFFVAERYRLPLVPLLAPAAAAGAGELLRAVWQRRLTRAAVLATILAATGIVVFPDWFGAGFERINADLLMGQVFLMRKEPRRAIEALERAGAAKPGDPDVLNVLGTARLEAGDLDGAEATYLRALQFGDFGDVWFNLGFVAEQRGPSHYVEAAGRYRRAITINPLDPRPRANLLALEPVGQTLP